MSDSDLSNTQTVPPRGRVRLRQDAVTWRFVDDEVVALQIDRSEYLSGNRTTAVLWEGLETGATPAELQQRLLDHFEVDADQAAADIDGLLGELSRRGLLEPC